MAGSQRLSREVAGIREGLAACVAGVGLVAGVHPKVPRECAGRREDNAACVARVGLVAGVHPKVPREFTVALECLAARRALIDAARILDHFRTVCDHLPLLFACTCAGSIEVVALLQTSQPTVAAAEGLFKAMLLERSAPRTWTNRISPSRSACRKPTRSHQRRAHRGGRDETCPISTG